MCRRRQIPYLLDCQRACLGTSARCRQQTGRDRLSLTIRRCVYRVRDEQHARGSAYTGAELAAKPSHAPIAALILEDADMAKVIGPVLRNADGYSFDTWTAGKGVTRGYPYSRVED